jgi:hypothetical protein
VSGSVKLNIHNTTVAGEPDGGDTSILQVADSWYVTVDDGPPALRVREVGRYLRGLSEDQAANLGRVLHHAEWTITSDPAEVRALGMMHDCATCRADMDQALAYLRENKDGKLAVGQLWWAASSH